MKTFFAILGLCIAQILAEATDTEQSGHLETIDCMRESGIDPVVLKKMVQSRFVDNDGKQGCFLACMAKKKGVMKSDGSIDESKFDSRDFVHKERAAEIINTCKVMKGANDCETARKIINCMYKEDDR